MRIFLVCLLLLVACNAGAKEVTVWIGMATPPPGQKSGIYRATLDDETGKLSQPMLAAEIKAPEFLALRPDGQRLYAAYALENGKGGVAAFEISPDTKSLRPLNTQPIGGNGACHVAVDPTGRCLFTAEYGDGTIAAFPLAADGQIQPRSALIQHAGSGPNKERQDGPHPHSANPAPKNEFLLVPDLGTDQIVVYHADPATGLLEARGHGTSPPGAGPRHMKFHPNGKFAYVLNELDLSVTVFKYDAATGNLEAIQTISSLPEEFRENSCTASEVCIHPNGRFLFAANRGHDSISAFTVDPESGKLTFVEREAIRGNNPRNFNLDPSGKWLLAGGLQSNTISVFKVNQDDGSLLFTGQTVNTPAPMCIVFQRQP